MSLTLALNNAISSLRVNQAAMAVLSQNIANANTEGYSRQVVGQEAMYVEGSGAGVDITEVLRKVDKYLVSSLQTKTSDVGRTQAVQDYMDRVQLLLGRPGENADLSSYIDNFFNALRDLADNPDQPSLRETTLGNATILVEQINALAQGFEDLRLEVDQEITRSIDVVNYELDHLHTLNISITNAAAVGNDRVGLLDERDKALKNLSEQIGIVTSERENGEVNVSTARGFSLLDPVNHYKLLYTGSASVTSIIDNASFRSIQIVPVNAEGNATGSANTLVGVGVEGSLDTDLESGRLRGLLEVRDIIMPSMLASLDEMTSTLRDSFNAIHNDGNGFPAVSTMTGTRALSLADSSDWTGSMTFGVFNPDGSAIENPYLSEIGGIRPFTLDLGTLDIGGGMGRFETQDVIDEFNAHFGPPQKKVHVGDLNNIRLVSMTENNPVGAAFSFDFDFENLMGDDITVDVTNIAIAGGVLASAIPATYTVDAGDSGRTGTAYSFDVTGAGPFTITIDVDVTNVDGSVTSSTIDFTVNTALTDIKNDRYVGTVTGGAGVEELPTNANRFATATLVDADGSVITNDTDEGYLKISTRNDLYVLSIDEGDSSEEGRLDLSPPEVGTHRGLSDYFELNDFFVRDGSDSATNSAIYLEIRADILANSSYISAGNMTQVKQPANPLSLPDWSYELGPGGNETAKQLADLALTLVSFDAAGTLPSTSRTIVDYAAAVLGSISTQALFAEQDLSQQQLLLTGFQDKVDSISGVNLDEEMANTIIFQNAYGATARVITVTKELFETLLQSF